MNAPHYSLVGEELDLIRRVRSFLASRYYPLLRNLRVEVRGDTVLLAGKVSTFHERQIALECCKRVAGVRSVVDELVVDSISPRRMSAEAEAVSATGFAHSAQG